MLRRRERNVIGIECLFNLTVANQNMIYFDFLNLAGL